MILRNLAYWKARKVDLRNLIDKLTPQSPSWAEMWNAYYYADTKVCLIEKKVLVKH